MHPVTTLMLVEGIQRERYGPARRPAAQRSGSIRQQPARRLHAASRPSPWSSMTSAYRLGFAARP